MSDVRLLQKSTYTYMKALPAYRAKIRSLYVQSVEHAAVNRRVVGSSPTGGAITVRLKSTMLENPREIEGFQAFMRQKLKSIFRAQNSIICSTKGT